eukprot:TRINITY_DN985_c0_g1_i3.p1 TRINITY_DN985_c0_g1~~TRINITY_DN985_c0_g1_i3.p1  ORF type:complete len:198 (+),score=31.36 TRINITY_DN985_c0_g1_i3:799-1392(+)
MTVLSSSQRRSGAGCQRLDGGARHAISALCHLQRAQIHESHQLHVNAAVGQLQGTVVFIRSRLHQALSHGQRVSQHEAGEAAGVNAQAGAAAAGAGLQQLNRGYCQLTIVRRRYYQQINKRSARLRRATCAVPGACYLRALVNHTHEDASRPTISPKAAISALPADTGLLLIGAKALLVGNARHFLLDMLQRTIMYV